MGIPQLLVVGYTFTVRVHVQSLIRKLSHAENMRSSQKKKINLKKIIFSTIDYSLALYFPLAQNSAWSE